MNYPKEFSLEKSLQIVSFWLILLMGNWFSGIKVSYYI